MKLLIFLFCCLSAFAGQSLRLNGAQTADNNAIPAQSSNAACRLEFQLVFTSSPTMGDFAGGYACGWTIQYNTGAFQIYPGRPTGWSCCITFSTTLFISNWANIRVQLIPSGMGGTITWEAWDIAGVLQFSHSETYTGTSGSNINGSIVLSTGSQNTTWGFFRLYTTTVPMGSTPPLFSDRGDLVDWEFDGNLNDSSGNGYTATSSAGVPAGSCGSAPCYTTTTPANPLVIATPRTVSAASWATWGWFALKTGVANSLTGLLSYSQADTPGVLTYDWAQTVGASAPLSSSSASQPTVTPPSDGPYAYTLQVTDGSGNMSNIVPLTLGSVTQDSNGVVSTSTDAAKLFGPMIAFGGAGSYWGWMDERAYSDIALQTTYLTTSQYNPPPFTTRGAGTIVYKYGGNFDCTTLSGNINSSTLSIGVTDATCLDLSTLPGTPTDIWVYNDGSANPRTYEIIRICSTSATSGAATLTACYDGRGAARSTYSYGTTQVQQPASSHLASGSGVGDSMTTGTSTLFITDSSRPMCPGGAPGFPGPVQYSTSTLTMTASSAVVTGSGTTWNLGNHVFAGQMIRIAATHASGSAFIFLATILSVDSTTQLTLSRAAPSDIDASAFSYKVIGGTDSGGTGFYFGSWGIKIPGTSPEVDTNIIENVQLCESETRLSSDRYFEGGAMLGSSQTGQTYSWKTTIGVTNGSALNFYGPGLALRAFNQRSGYAAPLTPANNLDDNWVNDPEIAAGYGFGGDQGFTVMGGIIGGIADKVLNASTTLEWDQLRNFGNTAWSGLFSGANATNCNASDARTMGAGGAIIALLALFDPDQQTHWNDYLYNNAQSVYAWENLCKDAVSPNSWANQGGTFNASTGPTITATNGSKNIVAISNIFTNGGIAPTSCTGGASSGTAIVTAGSDAMTAASGLVSGSGVQIVIDGTRLGQPYTLITDYQNNSGTSNTLGGLWPADADSGTVNWSLVTSPWYTTTFGLNQTDATTTLQNFVCTYVDDTHATLNRPWPFTTGTYHMFTYNIPGVVQQPFMLGGIFSHGLQWGALNADATIAAAFNTELGQAAGWMYTTGFDPYAKGPFYARVNQIYEPVIVPSSNYSASYITSTIAPGTDPESISIGFRELTGETSPTLRAVYTGTCNATTKTWGDEAYGGLWGKDSYNSGGVYSDSISVGNHILQSNLTDASLGSFKWSGFFFGLGMAHQWPAVRTTICSSTYGGITGKGALKGKGSQK